MLDEFLRQRRVRSNIEIVYTYPTVAQLLRNCLFMQQEVCEVLPAVFSERDIKAKRGFTLEVMLILIRKSPIRKKEKQSLLIS